MDEYNRYFLDPDFAAQETRAQRGLPKVSTWAETYVGKEISNFDGFDDYNRMYIDSGYAEQEAKIQANIIDAPAHERFRDFYRNPDKYAAANYDDNFIYEGTRYNGTSGSTASGVLSRPVSDNFKSSMENRRLSYEDSYGSTIDSVSNRYMSFETAEKRGIREEIREEFRQADMQRDYVANIDTPENQAAARKEEYEIRQEIRNNPQRQLGMQRDYELNINTDENQDIARAEEKQINKILAGDQIEHDKIFEKNRYRRLYDEGMTSDVYKQAINYRQIGHSYEDAKQLAKDTFIFKDITDGRTRLDNLFNSGDLAVRKNMIYSYFENPELMFKGNVSNQILDEVYNNANNVKWQKGYINSRLMAGDYKKSFGFEAGTKLSDLNKAQQKRLLNDFKETKVKHFNSLMETPEYTTVRGDERVLEDFKPKRRSVKDVITGKGKDIGDPDAGIGIIKTGSSYTAEGARIMDLNRQGGQRAMGVLEDAVKAYGSDSTQGRAVSAYKSFLSNAYDTGKRSVDLSKASEFLREHGMAIKEADSIQKAINKGIKAATNTNTSGISKAVRRMTKGKAAWIVGTAIAGTWAVSELWDE